MVGSDTEFAAYSQYDIAGNIVKTKDPKGNVAQVSYSSTYQYALPTAQTSPIPDTSGYYASATAFTTTSAYDFWTGKVTSTTDANSQVTTAEYNDVLDRLTRIVRPAGGGETTYQYGDTVGSLYLHTQTKQDASNWLDDYTLFDGLGRARRSAHFEGASSWSATETTYDALGRVSQVSNPFSISSYDAGLPGGVKWTTTAYDALSRVVTMTTPDTAFVTTSYSGNTVTVEDQHDPNDPDTTKRVGRKRTSITDALGRLTQVTEDPGGLSHQTYYTYDVLGNLVKVNQGSQNRYFLYDSLSRLVRARNVEQDVNSGLATSAAGTYPGLGNTQWTMSHSYDANGNLYQRQEARNNSSSVPILTTYGYDALNRNIWANYNDSYTPVIERHYDAATNGKGRLSYHLSYNSHPVTSAPAYSFMVINAYDAIGRPLSGSQQLLNPGGTWTAYAMSQSYDLAGHVLTQTYPSGKTITNSYATSGRLNSFSGNLGDGVTRTYADTFGYNAAGQMAKERFGTTTNLYHNIHYNSRLQPVDVRLGTSSTDEWAWNRGALITYYSNQARNIGNAFLDAKDNNGNVTMQEHYVPTDDAISSYSLPLRDTYEYDQLNRLTQTNGLQRNTGGAWTSDYAQWYICDQWGNRTIDNPHTWGTAINNAVYTINTANNRINSLTYDAAGNVTSDPNGVSTATYDGENRMRNSLKGGQWNYYVYDPDGRRVRRILGAQETWQIYGFGGELMAEYPVNGAASTPQKEYGYRDGQMLIVGGCDVVRWLMADHLGTPRIEADVTGGLTNVRRHDYLPFGEELLVGTGNGSIRTTGMGYTADCVRQRFGSKERDNETGLDYFLARYYSNIHGRFFSVDPENAGAKGGDPQSWNGYAFSRNSPIVYSDPNGTDYKLCYYGHCSFHSNPNVDEWKKTEGITFKGGKIFDKDGNKLGTYQEIDSRNGYFSTQGMGQLLTEALPQASDSVQKGVGIVAAPYAVAAGVAGGGAALGVGGIGFGTTVTTLGTLGRVAGPLATGGAAFLNQLGRTDSRMFQEALRLGLSVTKSFLENVDILTRAVRQVRPDGQLNQIGFIGNSPILGSAVSKVGIANVDGLTVVVKVVNGTPQIIGQLPK